MTIYYKPEISESEKRALKEGAIKLYNDMDMGSIELTAQFSEFLRLIIDDKNFGMMTSCAARIERNIKSRLGFLRKRTNLVIKNPERLNFGQNIENLNKVALELIEPAQAQNLYRLLSNLRAIRNHAAHCSEEITIEEAKKLFLMDGMVEIVRIILNEKFQLEGTVASFLREVESVALEKHKLDATY